MKFDFKMNNKINYQVYFTFIIRFRSQIDRKLERNEFID